MNAVYEATGSLDLGILTSGLEFEVAMIGLVACIVMAFFGMRLYKVCLSVLGAVGIGFVTYTVFKAGGILGDILPAMDGINVAAALGIITALIGFVLGLLLPKFVMFIGGVGMGCLATPIFIRAFVPSAGLDETIIIVIGIIVGIILGILLSLLFRPIYIISTSIGGMAIAVILLVSLIIPGMDPMTPAIVGAVIGIVPMIIQFRSYAF